MQATPSATQLSASDLSWFLGCRHRTALDMAVARGEREPPNWVDPLLALLRERGLDHERRFADSLRSQDRKLVDLADYTGEEAVNRSLDAMRSGTDVILQPALQNGCWFGRPDVLLRMKTPSALGSWSYEVYDTKLAKETKGGAVLQLALYSDLLTLAQGMIPENFHIVTPDPDAPLNTFRFQDFAAYLRLIRARLERTMLRPAGEVAAANYPEPVEHCESCRWWSDCDKRRRKDDHLCLVAGTSRLQRTELQAAGVATVAQLGALPVPLPFKPRRGAMETYIRAREQARVQLEARVQGTLVHELLPVIAGQGLTRLPAPSPGDLFMDIEGDPFAGTGGREYLFGLVSVGPDGALASRALWAYSNAEERVAFETAVDEIMRAWEADPAMHVYHYAPYEPAAFKRLMGRYATREADVDRMLRAALFVDLYAVVRHALRASVESYSIKDLEAFYGFERSVALADARAGLRVVERAIELGAADEIDDEVRVLVEGYNRDDCVSALRLREWLEQLRASLEQAGTPVPRPAQQDGAAPEKIDERAQKVRARLAALTADVPADSKDRDEEQQARWLLAQLLDWHRREDKAPWWEFFRLRDLTDDELLDEKAAISGMTLSARVGGTAKSPIDSYSYPLQDTDVREGDALHLTDGTDFGSVEAIDRVARTVDVKKRGAQAQVHPTAVFAHAVVNTEILADALLRIADDVIQDGIAGGTQYQAARQLLWGRPPRLRGGAFQQGPGESALQFAVRIAPELDDTILPVQGPPGAGKTFTGAHMICELVRRGARIGVTGVSHKVILNLLNMVKKVAADLGREVRCLQKVTTKTDPPSGMEETINNDDAIARLRDGRAQVLGGTQWLWARPEALALADVLIVDEAGQMSLANVLAASQGARSIVLLGDPQQLEQPQQGTHPEGADLSALEHMLHGHTTMPPDRGIFLPETWRLAPELCAFTSEVFYEGRLRSRPGLERQVLVGTAPIEGAGLWIAGVAHEGNQSSAYEEVEVVERLATGLLRDGGRWIDSRGEAQSMTPHDILVVAPYNAQVSLLGELLEPRGIRVGTVDKFQGQEAPVVIYSMATSTPEDAPRGMEFLYSMNRLNVATSRARCACIVVASPRLFEPECKSPRQMQLANAICRYVELAKFIDPATL
ncbi:MAG: TM0106 family RecB-like putative nuclease [Pseudomonadota bacterium]